MSDVLSRRRFIQKMGLTVGASFLNPVLDTLISQAQGQALNSKRMIIYMSGAHMPRNWMRTGGSNPNFTLPETLTPLEPYKNEMLVLGNLYNTVYPNLHGNLYGTLSGYPSIGVPASDDFAYLNARPGGPSFDTVMSNELGGGTPHKEMVVGYVRPSQTGMAYDRDSVKPSTMNPADVLKKYLTGALPGVNNQQANLMRKSFLDFAVNDIQRAYRGLAGEEKGKFLQFLDSLKEVQTQLAAGAPVTQTQCGEFKIPSAGTGPNGQTYPLLPYYTDFDNRPWWNSGDGFCGSNFVIADMVALALGCGVTRHATFVSAYHEAHQRYPDIGVPVDVHEQICHQLERTGYQDQEAVQRGKNIIKYHASVVAKMYADLKKIPEGNGTAADNTVILWFCDVGGEHHYGHRGYTAIMVGKCGGALKTGASYEYGVEQYSMCQLYYTLAKALGSKATRIGDGTNPGSSVIPGILA